VISEDHAEPKINGKLGAVAVVNVLESGSIVPVNKTGADDCVLYKQTPVGAAVRSLGIIIPDAPEYDRKIVIGELPEY